MQLSKAGRWDEAEPLFRGFVAANDPGETWYFYSDIGWAGLNHANALEMLGRLEESETVLLRVLECRNWGTSGRGTGSEGWRNYAWAQLTYAGLMTKMGRRDEAQELYAKMIAYCDDRFGAEDRLAQYARERLATLESASL